MRTKGLQEAVKVLPCLSFLTKHELKQHKYQAEKEHKDGNPVNTVHHSQVEIACTFSEHRCRIEIVKNALEKHTDVLCGW